MHFLVLTPGSKLCSETHMVFSVMDLPAHKQTNNTAPPSVFMFIWAGGFLSMCKDQMLYGGAGVPTCWCHSCPPPLNSLVTRIIVTTPEISCHMTPLPLGQGHGKRKHTHVRSRVSGENPVETMSGVFGDLSAVFESQYTQCGPKTSVSFCVHTNSSFRQSRKCWGHVSHSSGLGSNNNQLWLRPLEIFLWDEATYVLYFSLLIDCV